VDTPCHEAALIDDLLRYSISVQPCALWLAQVHAVLPLALNNYAPREAYEDAARAGMCFS
jgi:hypothetical protein